MTEKDLRVSVLALEDNTAEVRVIISRKFYDFIKGYLQFFADQTSVEDFCRGAIYEAAKTIYKNFDNQSKISMHISEADWLRKWEALSIASMPEERDLPSYEAGVQFTNKEFLDDIEKAAEKQQMDRDEFIRYVMRRELDRLGR